jgi:hypothetical protein
VTHNTADFADLAKQFSAENCHHAGMILCVRRPPRELADRISAVLHRLGDGLRKDVVLFA